MLAVSPPLVLAAHVQFLHPRNERVVESRPVPLQSFLFHGVQPNPLDTRGCAGEIPIDQVIVQPDGFEDLGSPVRLHRGDAHLGHYLEDAFFIGLDEVVDRILRLGTVQLAAFGQITNGFQGQVGIDAASAVTDQQAAMLNFSRLSRFYDQANPGPRAGAGQMMVNRAGGQQAGNGSVVGVHAAVGQNDEVLALGNGLRRSVAQVVQSPVHRSRFRLEQRGQRGRRHSRQVQGLDLRQLLVGEQRRLELQLPAVLRTFVEQVLLAADKRFQRSDQLLPDRVQRRVGHLGKQLLEIIKQGAVLVRQHRQRRVVAHGADRFVSGRGHGRGQHAQFFDGEAERALLLPQVVTPGRRQRLGVRQAFQFYLIALEPIAIGLAAGQCVLQLFVADDPALVEADQEHAARLQPTFLPYAFRRQVQHAGLGRHDQLIVVGHRVPERP